MTTLAEENVLRETTADRADAEPVLMTAEVTDGPAADITIVKGSPTDTEVAAIVAVLNALAAGAAPDAARPPETWGLPVQLHRGAAPLSPYSFLTHRQAR